MANLTASPWIFASALLLGLGACGDDVADSASAGSTSQNTSAPGSSSSGVTPTGSVRASVAYSGAGAVAGYPIAAGDAAAAAIEVYPR